MGDPNYTGPYNLSNFAHYDVNNQTLVEPLAGIQFTNGQTFTTNYLSTTWAFSSTNWNGGTAINIPVTLSLAGQTVNVQVPGVNAISSGSNNFLAASFTLPSWAIPIATNNSGNPSPGSVVNGFAAVQGATDGTGTYSFASGSFTLFNNGNGTYELSIFALSPLNFASTGSIGWYNFDFSYQTAPPS